LDAASDITAGGRRELLPLFPDDGADVDQPAAASEEDADPADEHDV
jgi:hypothetical protein